MPSSNNINRHTSIDPHDNLEDWLNIDIESSIDLNYPTHTEISEDRQRLNRLGQRGEFSSRGLEDNELLSTLEEFNPEAENQITEQSKLIKDWESAFKNSALNSSQRHTLRDIVQKIKAAIQINNPEKASELLETLRSEASEMDIYLETDGTFEAQGSSEERRLFKENVKNFQKDFSAKINEIRILDQEIKNSLLQELESKVSIISNMKHLESAQSRLDKLEQSLKGKLDEVYEAEKKSLKKEKVENLDKAIMAMDRVIQLDNRSEIDKPWGHEKAAMLANKLKVYLSSVKGSINSETSPPSASEISQFMKSINKDEVNNIVQYITGAIFEVADKNNTTWQQIMASAFTETLLSDMAKVAGDEVAKLNDSENIGDPNRLTYWTPNETINRLNALSSNHELQKYFGQVGSLDWHG